MLLKPDISLDYRSVGIFRILLSAVLIIDLIVNRLPTSIELYSNDGFLTTTALKYYPRTTGISFLYYITSPGGVRLFFLVYLVFCVLLLVGFKTKYFSVLVFLCLFSIQDRVLPFVYGADDLLRLSAFWSMFLPLDKCFTLFSRKPKATSNIASFKNILSFTILLQVSLIYLFNGLFKNGETWQDGTAVSYAVSILDYRTDWSYILYENELLSRLFSIITTFFQKSILFLIFFPFMNGKLRIAASILILFFHFGLAPFLDVGLFYLSALPFAILILPTYFWNKLEFIIKK